MIELLATADTNGKVPEENLRCGMVLDVIRDGKTMPYSVTVEYIRGPGEVVFSGGFVGPGDSLMIAQGQDMGE